MQLENYFTFLNAHDIRIKGTRIGIETILYEYIYQHKSPENIAELYPNLQLEQIYATILYFLSKPVQVTQYMSDWLDYCQTSEQEQDENPPAYIQRLRQLKAERSLVK